MLFTLLCLPLTIVTGLGALSWLGLLTLASPAIIAYTTKPGAINHDLQVQDYILTFTSCALVAIYFTIEVSLIIVTRFETYFDTLPWAERDRFDNKPTAVRDKSIQESSGQRFCPFTGSVVNRLCPSCGSLVNKKAFKEPKYPFLLELFGQQEVLLWKSAKKAIADPHDPDEAREKLDTLLKFTGNASTLTLASCCAGCHTWQMTFNVGRRLALTLALSSIFFAFFTWAFYPVLELIGAFGLVLKVMCGVLAQTLAAATVVLQTKLIAAAVVFLADNVERDWCPKDIGKIPSAAIRLLKVLNR
jgi:hypothetical protein